MDWSVIYNAKNKKNAKEGLTMRRPRRKKMSSKDRLLTFRLSEAEKDILVQRAADLLLLLLMNLLS